MSKRCKLQKEYYKEFGNYKGSGKYTDHYVNWLESKVLAINYTRCSTQLKNKNSTTIKKYATELLDIEDNPKNSNKEWKKVVIENTITKLQEVIQNL